jgi:beta-lactamase class A
VDGSGCRAIHGIAASTAAPLGSAFKLIVLDALARTIDAGTVTWDQQLTVTNNVKSLPSGELQTKPAGTRVSVEQAATMMISISDNTAADMLIGLVGRQSVEHAMTAVGIADPARNIPFPTTRELFQLKLRDWPSLANRYLAADSAGRSGILMSLDPLALPSASPWTTSRDIETLEWFASPADICKLYADLMALSTRPSLAPLKKILSANTGEIPVDAKAWPTIWFKGGSEPGVLTLNYLATSVTGKTYVVSMMVADPDHPLPEPATASLLAAAAGALQLART